MAVSYSIEIRSSTEDGYVLKREDSSGATPLHEVEANLTLDAALDRIKALVLANAVPDRITATVIPQA